MQNLISGELSYIETVYYLNLILIWWFSLQNANNVCRTELIMCLIQLSGSVLECPLSDWEVGVQSPAKSYQGLWKWYQLLFRLALSTKKVELELVSSVSV